MAEAPVGPSPHNIRLRKWIRDDFLNNSDANIATATAWDAGDTVVISKSTGLSRLDSPPLMAVANVAGAAANTGLLFQGSATATAFSITTAGRALIDDADAAAQRTTLGLGNVSTAGLLDEDDMTSNSAVDVPSQQSTKAYVDAQLSGLCRIKTGTYTGDGTTSQAITGVGFAPKFVMIWHAVTAGNNSIVFTTTDTIVDNDASGLAHLIASSGAGSNTMEANRIISLDSDGFTVDDSGTDSAPNANGASYEYMCLG